MRLELESRVNLNMGYVEIFQHEKYSPTFNSAQVLLISNNASPELLNTILQKITQ